MRSAFCEERLWAAGRRELTLLALPDLERDRELADLIGKVRDVAIRYPATDRPLPDQWLHMTVQAINHTLDDPAVSDSSRNRLIVELEKVFATTAAFTVMVGSVMAYGVGIMCDVHADKPFSAMAERVRAVVADICGPDSIRHDSRPAHMMLSYSHGDQDGDPLQRLLRRLRPGLAPMTVDTIVLAEVVQDPQGCAYRWDVVHQFCLQGSESVTDAD
jgi:hypothetical protein